VATPDGLVVHFPRRSYVAADICIPAVFRTTVPTRRNIEPEQQQSGRIADGFRVGAPSDELRADASRALRNASKLGLSLVLTWSVALVARIFMPRFLGPAVFGQYQFAESFAIMLFVLTNFGADTYIQKEVSRNASHASDFIGGVLALRLAGSAAIMVAAAFTLSWAGKPEQVRELVIILGFVQLLVLANQLAVSLLQAVGQVNGLSVLAVGAKLLWASGILLGLMSGLGVRSVALGLLASEMLRSIVLWWLSRRHLNLRLRLNVGATRLMLAASLPFFLKDLAFTLCARMDVGIMSFMTNDAEVGWYGVASNIAGIAMLLTPIIGAVFLPLSSRASSRSDAEVAMVASRAMQLVLTVAIPVSLGLALGADVLVRVMFGEAFAPAVGSLRVLAPVFVLTYVAMITSLLLLSLGRGWTLTYIALSSLVITPVLYVLLIPWGLKTYGPGGAGIGAGAAMVIAESYMAGLMAWLMRRYIIDTVLVVALKKMTVVAIAVVVAFWILKPLGDWRLAIVAAGYTLGVVWWGAVDPGVIVRMLRRTEPMPAVGS